MRQDKVIFNGENPFNEFVKCRELTVILGEDTFIFVATLNAINIMRPFKSDVSILNSVGGKIREGYTIPLSLILPLFKLDTKSKENSLTLETAVDQVTITYNGVSVTTDLYSPNGLTLHQIKAINSGNPTEVDPLPFIKMSDLFGVTKDNFCNVDGKTLFIEDETKCLIHDSKIDYGRKFSISIQFIKLMKSMECIKLFIGNNLVAETKTGLRIITSLTKITNNNILMDYKFASKLAFDSKYTIAINKYVKHVNIAVQTADLSISLDLNKRELVLSSESNERTSFKLSKSEIDKQGEFEFFSEEEKEDKSIILTDSRLIKSLASFSSVKVKICPTFLLAKLSDTHKLMFTLGRA